MSKFILAGVAVALTVFIFFAYQLKAEKQVFPVQPQQNWERYAVPEHGSVYKPEHKRATNTPRTYEEALALSKESGKLIVLYFTAPGRCEPCRAMQKTTLKDKMVKSTLDSYVFYQIDVDGSEQLIARRWRVTQVPTYIVTDYSQRAQRVGLGYRSPESFVAWLSSPTTLSCNIYYIPAVRPVIVTARQPVRHALQTVEKAVVATERAIVCSAKNVWSHIRHPVCRTRLVVKERYC